MPFRWIRGTNPYTENDFRLLKAGRSIVPKEIVQQAENLKRQISAGGRLEIHNRTLTVIDIQAASKRLLDPVQLAEEQLLAHPVPDATSSQAFDIRPHLAELLSLALSDEQHEATELAAFLVPCPGDAADRASDIIFDS